MTKADIEGWVREYGPLVFAVCAKVLRDRESASDASQRVWEIVVRNAGSFRGHSKPGTWIYSIAYREAQRAAKKERRTRYRELLHAYRESDWRPVPAKSDDASAHRWLSEKCDSCLTGVIMTLPFKARMVFTFRYILDLPFGEIADITGMREDAVRQSAARARKTLAGFLENECGIFRPATPCRCGLEAYLDRASFRADMLALRTITRIARGLHDAGFPLPALGYWESIQKMCHKTAAPTL